MRIRCSSPSQGGREQIARCESVAHLPHKGEGSRLLDANTLLIAPCPPTLEDTRRKLSCSPYLRVVLQWNRVHLMMKQPVASTDRLVDATCEREYEIVSAHIEGRSRDSRR